MVYALNIKKGTTISNPDLGKLEGGIARKIDPSKVNIAKHLINVVVFERIEGIDEPNLDNQKTTMGKHRKSINKSFGIDLDNPA